MSPVCVCVCVCVVPGPLNPNELSRACVFDRNYSAFNVKTESDTDGEIQQDVSEWLVDEFIWLKFELTHKCTLIQQPFLSSMDCVFPGAGCMYILGLVMSLTREECCVVPFVVVIFFKSRYLPLL